MLSSMSLTYTFSELLSLPEEVLVQQLVKIKDKNGNIILDTSDDPELAPRADQDVVREKILCAKTSPSLLIHCCLPVLLVTEL